MRGRDVSLVAALAWPAVAMAHVGVVTPIARPLPWTFHPTVTIPLLLMLVLYVGGALRFRSRPPRTRDLAGPRQSWAFAAAFVVLVAALVSPLHALGERVFAAHMVQHVLLVALAAPLLVVSRSTLVMRAALPGAARRVLTRLAHRRALHAAGRGLRLPVTAWSLHAAALWVWHLPSLFDATRTSDLVHAAQHVSFLGSAWLFWSVALDARPGRSEPLPALLMIFATAVHGALLGALLTFARAPWYSGLSHPAAGFGLTPLEDQQLGGLIMWVPAGFAYLFAALAVAARALDPVARGGRGARRLALQPDGGRS